jgi:hypothetical protein
MRDLVPAYVNNPGSGLVHVPGKRCLRQQIQSFRPGRDAE